MKKLYINTFGGFNLLINDESLLDKSDRSYRLHKLFQYFITFRNKKLLPESIIDNLWQDNDSFDPKNMLRAQIFRLRQAIKSYSQDAIDLSQYLNITFSNGYYTLIIGENTIVDTDAFEDLITKGDKIRYLDIDSAIESYRSAIKLYKGPYLEENSYEMWLLPIKNYYRRLYLKTLFKLIELLKEKEKYEDIIAICEDALALHPYEEAIHIYLMESMLKMGQVKNALSHYEYVSSINENESTNMTSLAMSAIYRKIKSYFNEKSEIHISNISSKLEDFDTSGPLYCDSEYFKFLFNLQKRKRKSGQELDYVCLMTLEDDLSKVEVKTWTMEMTSLLGNSLRKGDIFTFWNDTQIIIILSNVRENGPIIIEKRIRNELSKSTTYNINIEFTVLNEESKYAYK